LFNLNSFWFVLTRCANERSVVLCVGGRRQHHGRAEQREVRKKEIEEVMSFFLVDPYLLRGKAK
jgi:hypothetical protein